MNYKINPFYLQTESIDKGLMQIFLTSQEIMHIISTQGDFNITQNQIIFLLIKPHTSEEICRILQISRQNFHQMIKKIKHLINISTPNRDRRKIFYILNHEGIKLRQELLQPAINKMAKHYKKYGAESVAGLDYILQDFIHEL